MELGFCAVLPVASAPCLLISFTGVLLVTGVVSGVGQGQASFRLSMQNGALVPQRVPRNKYIG